MCALPVKLEPRPPPTTPRPWASSDISQASYSFATASSSASGAKIAVHGEHAVGDDQRVIVLGAVRDQQFARMRDVVVAEGEYRAARKLRAGIEAGVRQFIEQHQPVAADQHRDDAGIGEIAGAEHDRRLGLLDAAEPAFEFGVKRVIAGDQARGAGASAVALERFHRRLLDGRMLAQVEIVVAGKRQQPAAVALDPDARLRDRYR